MEEKKNLRRQDALDYHSKGRPGKIEVVTTKETATQRDLSLAYSPGVAEPCLAIAQNPEDVYTYTAKGNLVAVISNGTAVLGLGDIGPEAGKPVMEGKGVLFKIYSDIDVFDIELNTKNVDEFVRTVKILEPTFGGVNLEDIKAPECFEIEDRLRKELKIPVMHDDQHGTAIISGAALLNALEIVGKKISEVRFVISGAGAAAISCTKMYVNLGARKENITMFDKDGTICLERDNIFDIQREFAVEKSISMVDAVKGADVFIGLSAANVLSQDMVRSMGDNPIVFAMANPSPEISYEDATAARPDIIMATGRSDYPNQVNNVLGFPYIFRGALDVRATGINEAMKMAATYALAELTKEPVPDIVTIAYNEKNLSFGRNYIIPKPMDPRLLTKVAPAVAKAAMESGLATQPIEDWEAYEQVLAKRLGQDNQLTRAIVNKAKKDPKKVVFADAESQAVLKAVQQVWDEGICEPILLGNQTKIRQLIKEDRLELEGIQIIDPRSEEAKSLADEFASAFYEKRKRRGISPADAQQFMLRRTYFGAMMVETGKADCLISGLTRNYPDTIRPSLQIIGRREGISKVCGMYILLTKKGPLFLSDTTVNFNPTVEELVEITELTANSVESMGVKPRIALLTYSNFGTADGEDAEKMRKATAILRGKHPDWVVEGEMQAHLAFNTDLVKQQYPFSDLAEEGANVLIFPNLSAANIAYNLLKEVGDLEYIGPVLLGLKKPVHVLQLGSSVREIVNMVAIAVTQAQEIR
ncbi:MULTISPECIES: NADP-dependent malic enzyme [unclassified Siphonobacter]|uniref:NADP-dependent malic enzyme n=1 Tax=unclassified Siphonobacter TaxID=2635712 RepID=UPI0027853CA1|nr:MULTISPECIES: NADP-dependent malic enzyme [unclassified Siphonobacter]MDQ1089096.1 malate dehydrogenase (oxaloacetate-decarboxylating)(NADP+) [Siphonobacter sp. SORGH_AS_1065]MDR6195273.1 malate dehydrogenase (oxaloacetate-decarboxylating)(NADP+) [Siphonobacter sp. SORGH_AS_0500]